MFYLLLSQSQASGIKKKVTYLMRQWLNPSTQGGTGTRRRQYTGN